MVTSSLADQVSDQLLRRSSLTSFLACFASVCALAYAMSFVEAQLEELAPFQALDKRGYKGYTADEAHTLLADLGPKGRDLYLKLNVLDCIVAWPAAGMLSVLLGPLYNKLSWWPRANLLPLTFLVLDVSENLAIRVLLSHYPSTLSHAAARLADKLTRGNFMSQVLILSAIGVAALALAWRRLQSHSNSQPSAAKRSD